VKRVDSEIWRFLANIQIGTAENEGKRLETTPNFAKKNAKVFAFITPPPGSKASDLFDDPASNVV
jgi:hypothetical protein